LSIFQVSVFTDKFSIKSDKNNGYFTWRTLYIIDHNSLTCS